LPMEESGTKTPYCKHALDDVSWRPTLHRVVTRLAKEKRTLVRRFTIPAESCLQYSLIARVFELVFYHRSRCSSETTTRRRLLNPGRCLHANATTVARPRSLPLKLIESTITFRAPSRVRSQHLGNATLQSTQITRKHSTRLLRPHLPLALRPALPGMQRHRDTESKTTQRHSSPPTSGHQGDDTHAPCMTTMQFHNPALPEPRSKRSKKPKSRPKHPLDLSQTTPKPCTPSPSTN
jgi:hypothetical protein